MRSEKAKEQDRIRKQRHYIKKYNEAPFIECACGCGGKIKNVDKYGRSKEYINGHNGRKYDDPKQYQREWGYRNRGKIFKSKMRRHRMLKVKLISMSNNQCSDCGLKYDGGNACVFQLHHLDPSIKKGNVLHMLTNKNWVKVIDEFKKCELLCANCHFKTHWNRF